MHNQLTALINNLGENQVKSLFEIAVRIGTISAERWT